MLGIFLVLPIFTLYGLQFSKSLILVGFAFGGYPLTMAIFQVPLGRLSDRIGRRKVLLLGMSVFAGGSFLCAMPAWFPHSWQIWVLLIGRMVQGCGAIVSTAFATLADHIEPERRSLAMAALGIPIGASFVVGVVGGPWLAGVFGNRFEVLFWLTGALALLTDGFVLRYLPDAPPHAEARAPLGEVLRNKSLLAIDGGGFLLNFFLSAFFLTFPLLATSQLHLNPRQYYLILLPMLVANGFAMFAISRAADKGHARPFAAVSFLLMAASALLLFRPGLAGMNPNHLLAVLIPGALFFVGFGGLEPVLPSEVSKRSPKSAYGTALGAYNTMNFVGSAAGGPLAGLLAHSPTQLMIALVVASLAGVALMVLRPSSAASGV